MAWIRSELAALVALVAATLVVCQAWMLDPAIGFVERDAGFALVGVQWLQTALLHGGDVWGTPLGWPLPEGTTLVDWMPGQALLALPARLAGWDPYVQHEVIVGLGLVLTAWACHLAAVALAGRGPHTWVAGVIGGVSSAQMSHAQHVNLVHHHLAVGGGLLLAVGLMGRRAGMAAGGALVVAMAGHFGAYMGLHAALAGGVVLAAGALGRLGDRRSWAGVMVGGALGAASMMPVWRHYDAAAARDRISVSDAEIAAESWDPATTLRLVARAPLHDLAAGEAGAPDLGPRPRVGRAPAVVPATSSMDPPNPGYLATGLALVGVLAGRRREGVPLVFHALPLVLLGLCLLLALGPWVRWAGSSTGIPGPAALIDLLLGGPRLRAPARWFGLAWPVVGVLASLGLARLVGGRRPWVQVLAGCLALAVAVGETPRAGVGPLSDVAIEPAAREVARISGEGALYENRGVGCPGAGQNFHAAMWHGRPLVGGNYARAFGAIQKVNHIVGSWPSPEALVFLEAVGTRVTYEHPPLRPLPPGAGDCVLVDGHRICALTPRVPPARFATEGPGPVAGLQWPSPPDAAVITVRCGAVTTTVPTRVWETLTRLRLGAGSRVLEVLLDPACAETPTVDAGSPVPLYIADPTPWLPPFPARSAPPEVP